MFMIKNRLADAICIRVMPKESRIPGLDPLVYFSTINSFWPVGAVGRRVSAKHKCPL